MLWTFRNDSRRTFYCQLWDHGVLCSRCRGVLKEPGFALFCGIFPLISMGIEPPEPKSAHVCVPKAFCNTIKFVLKQKHNFCENSCLFLFRALMKEKFSLFFPSWSCEEAESLDGNSSSRSWEHCLPCAVELPKTEMCSYLPAVMLLSSFWLADRCCSIAMGLDVSYWCRFSFRMEGMLFTLANEWWIGSVLFCLGDRFFFTHDSFLSCLGIECTQSTASIYCMLDAALQKRCTIGDWTGGKRTNLPHLITCACRFN